LRAESYAQNAWPAPLAAAFQRNGSVVAVAMSLGIALVLILSVALQDPAVLFGAHQGPGAFYRLIPAWLMIAVASGTFLFSLLAMFIGAVKFWRSTESPSAWSPKAFGQAVYDVLTLRYLGGGGEGCNDQNEAFSQKRRWLHHTMFYGFLLCFASTTMASFYEHVLHVLSPFPFWSPPVLLGTVGGVLMVVGTGGLLWVKAAGDTAPASPQHTGADVALLLLLLLVSLTGLVLLVLRDTPAMGILLSVHLGFVLALFVVMPYSKFVHGVYRSMALLRNAVEARAGGVTAFH
ncbi:MAG TPA: tricarballylate utilization 4Fe-4S protein TcuB, partial [bacterium]